MRTYYQQVLVEASRAVNRFIEDEPANNIEAAVFGMIRQIGDAIGEMLQRWLDQLRGLQPLKGEVV